MNVEVKVLEMRPLNSGRSLRAFVDIQVGGWIIREWRVVKENGKRPRIVSPQISWKDLDGQIKYKTVVTLPDEVKGQIDFAILKAYTEEMEKKSDEEKR